MNLITGPKTLRQIADDLRCSKLHDQTRVPFAEFWCWKECHWPFWSQNKVANCRHATLIVRCSFHPKEFVKQLLPPGTSPSFCYETSSAGKRFTRVDLRRNSRFFSLSSMCENNPRVELSTTVRGLLATVNIQLRQFRCFPISPIRLKFWTHDRYQWLDWCQSSATILHDTTGIVQSCCSTNLLWSSNFQHFFLSFARPSQWLRSSQDTGGKRETKKLNKSKP